MAIDSYSSYICCIGNLTSDAKLPKKGTKWEQNVRENYTSDDVIDRGANSTSQQAASRLPEACDFSLSQFAFVLAHENESGCIQEIVVERRVEDEAAIPHFSSVTSKDLSPQHASGNPLSGFQNFAQLNSISDASSSKNTLPIQVISHQNHISKNLRAFLTLERPDNGVMLLSRCWFGTGSLFGFDITLSISEIQTIMSMSSSLSEVASQNTIKKLEKNDWSYSHEVDNCLEAMIPDGAIVAIQDVNQHMYFTVEGEEKTFRVGGVIHYSLVGERALFR
ncbi:Vacuolar protein sorting-associated protein 13 [Vigna unguiculata]|uniref:Vacuolar protein sorting-associated protein 13 n=1 Tax=Vigna unguiculata TaxID=3917 RepID=A0A4D6MX39_VIGUN|nr:Vacuolar protein sorting-associated protein 13 [Vigna unguiculata]